MVMVKFFETATVICHDKKSKKKKKDVKESLDLVYLALEIFTVHMLLV